MKKDEWKLNNEVGMFRTRNAKSKALGWLRLGHGVEVRIWSWIGGCLVCT